jgi:hypothetical protein
MVASIIRTIFAQPDREHVQKQFLEVTTMLGRSPSPRSRGGTGAKFGPRTRWSG